MIILIMYISLVIIGLYLYRVYNIGHILDFKIFVRSYNAYIMLNIPLIFKFYIILHLILLLIIFFLLLLNIHKFSRLELFKTYIFMNYNYFLRTNHYTKTLYNLFENIGLCNIISFFISTSCYHVKLFLKDLEISHGAFYKEYEMPDYKFSSLIHNIVHHKFFKFTSIYTFDIILYYTIIFTNI